MAIGIEDGSTSKMEAAMMRVGSMRVFINGSTNVTSKPNFLVTFGSEAADLDVFTHCSANREVREELRIGLKSSDLRVTVAGHSNALGPYTIGRSEAGGAQIDFNLPIVLDPWAS